MSVSQSIYDAPGFHPERLASGHTLGTSTSATHSVGRTRGVSHSARAGQISETANDCSNGRGGVTHSRTDHSPTAPSTHTAPLTRPRCRSRSRIPGRSTDTPPGSAKQGCPARGHHKTGTGSLRTATWGPAWGRPKRESRHGTMAATNSGACWRRPDHEQTVSRSCFLIGLRADCNSSETINNARLGRNMTTTSLESLWSCEGVNNATSKHEKRPSLSLAVLLLYHGGMDRLVRDEDLRHLDASWRRVQWWRRYDGGHDRAALRSRRGAGRRRGWLCCRGRRGWLDERKGYCPLDEWR